MTKIRSGSTGGFTLIEMAVALFIITLLLGGILVPLASRVEQKQISDTEKTLNEIKEALIGYAVAYGNLPCPDTSNDGAENVNTGTGRCSVIGSSNIVYGNLPWQTLGVTNASDVWGNRFRYAVRDEYARRSTSSTFTLSTTNANVRVCETASTCGSSLTSSAVAVVLSHGKNGYGATNSSGATNAVSASTDEQENTDNDRDFVSRIMTDQDASAGEFDDIVTWLPLYVLFNRMVAAGKLP